MADDPLSEVLSQSEVERLLAQVQEEEGSTIVYKADGSRPRIPKDSVQGYDFRHPVFLSASELRKLRLRHEEFIRALAAKLSIYLRLDCGLQMAKLNTITFQKFTESLANPTHLTLFKVEPLRGICILDVNPRLGLTIVDRLMGGAAHSAAINRDLSELEIALLDQAIQLMLVEWCNHWSTLQELRLVVLGHESNGRFLQTAPHDAVMLALSMEARIGDCMEQIQIGFPYYTLEPLVRKLGEELDAESEPVPNPATAGGRWNRDFESVTVPLTALWDDLEITARDLLNLKPGDVLRLSQEAPTSVKVLLGNVPKFHATLGSRGKNLAVCLNQLIKR
jgi:flagellar motor switch protein FliM